MVKPEFILNQCLDGDTSQCDKVKRGLGGDLWVGSDVDRSGHIVSLLDNLAIEDVQGTLPPVMTSTLGTGDG